MNKNKLFSDFPPVSTADWENKIKKDLRGADYEEKLVTKTREGFKIKPYYRQEDLEKLEYLNILPNEFPFVRGNKTDKNSYLIRQDIFVDDYKKANHKAENIIKKGITSIGFMLEHKKNISEKDFFDLLNNIDFSEVEINFISGINSVMVLKLLNKYISKNTIDISLLKGSIYYDPLGYRTVTDKCYVTDNCTGLEKAKAIFDFTDKNIPNLKILSVNALHFRNSGSTVVEELAFAMAIGSDYLSNALDLKISIEKLCEKMMFIFGIGSNYFIEIAKIRAARLLWAKIVEAYNPENHNSGKMYIHSVTCDYNKNSDEPFTNVLKTTTEAMSAIIGGVNSLLVNSFDKSYKTPDEFSERIARNIPVILKEEAYFDKVIDPSAGSYYIENLTNSIAEHSWKLFTKIEKSGGYFEALKKGIIKIKN